jgi:hypothetical protein
MSGNDAAGGIHSIQVLITRQEVIHSILVLNEVMSGVNVFLDVLEPITILLTMHFDKLISPFWIINYIMQAKKMTHLTRKAFPRFHSPALSQSPIITLPHSVRFTRSVQSAVRFLSAFRSSRTSTHLTVEVFQLPNHTAPSFTE